MMYFFTEPDKLQNQTAAQAFGAIDDKNFQISSRHQLSTPTPAICAVDGVPRYVNDNVGRLTCVIKPTSFVEFGGAPVAYFIYWGIEENSILSGSNLKTASGNNDNSIIDHLFDSIESPDTGHLGLDKTFTDLHCIDELFVEGSGYFINGGIELGTFPANMDIGFAVVLKSSFNKPKVQILRSLSSDSDIVSINTTNDNADEQSLKRNSIINFMDPVAFFGNDMLNNGNWANQIDVLSKFKYHRWYFDIRNENDLPFNIYGTSNGVLNSLLYQNNVTPSAISKALLTTDWPLFCFSLATDDDNATQTVKHTSKPYGDISIGVEYDKELLILLNHVYKGKKGVRVKKGKAYTQEQPEEHKNKNDNPTVFDFTSNVIDLGEAIGEVIVPNYNRISITHINILKPELTTKDSSDFIKTTTDSFLHSYSLLDNIFEVKDLTDYKFPIVSSLESACINDLGGIIASNFDVNIQHKEKADIEDYRVLTSSIAKDASKAIDENNQEIALEDDQVRITFFAQTMQSSMDDTVNYHALSSGSVSESSLSHINNTLTENKLVKTPIETIEGDEFDSFALVGNYEMFQTVPSKYFGISMTKEEYNGFVADLGSLFSTKHPVYFQIHDFEPTKDVYGKKFYKMSLRLAGLGLDGKPLFVIPSLKNDSAVKLLEFISCDGRIFASKAAAALEVNSQLVNSFTTFQINSDNVSEADKEMFDIALELVMRKSNELSSSILSKINAAIVNGVYTTIPKIFNCSGVNVNDIALTSTIRKRRKLTVSFQLSNDSSKIYDGETKGKDVLKAFWNPDLVSSTPGDNFIKTDDIANLTEYDSIGLKSLPPEPLVDAFANGESNDYNYKLNGIYSIAGLETNPLSCFEPKLQLTQRCNLETAELITDGSDDYLKVYVSELKKSGIGEFEGVTIDINLAKLQNDNYPIFYRNTQNLTPRVDLKILGDLRVKHLKLAKLILHELAHTYMYIYNPLLSDAWSYLEAKIENSGAQGNYVFNEVDGEIHDGHLYGNPSGALSVLVETELGRIFDEIIFDAIKDYIKANSLDFTEDKFFNYGETNENYFDHKELRYGAIKEDSKPTLGL